MDALNSIPMYVFIFSTAIFAMISLLVEPFTESSVLYEFVQHTSRLAGLTVVVSGFVSLGLLQGYSYIVSLVFGAVAWYWFPGLGWEIKKNKPEANQD